MYFLHIKDYEAPNTHDIFVQTLAEQMGKTYMDFSLKSDRLYTAFDGDDIEDYCAAHDVDMVFISLENESRGIQKMLDALRTVRFPYVFLTSTMQKIKAVKRILVPVTMFEEEVYKAQILSHVGRFTQAHILLLQAKDYGSKAEKNVQKIAGLMDSFALDYETQMAKKDSMHISKEATDRQKDFLSDMIMLTASRDYGLDDLIFGPPERHVITRSNVPVMLTNPRGDLFDLCD